MTQRGQTLLAVALGVLGAGLAVALLLMGQMGSIVPGTGELIGEPILAVGAGVGFLMGVLAAVVWSLVQWLFTPSTPRA